MDKPIVVVGSPDDPHVAAVREGLRQRGVDPFVFDAKRFPHEMTLSLGQAASDITVDGTPLGDPRSAYVRSLYQSPGGFGVDAEAAMEEDWRRTLAAYRERSTVLSAVLLRWHQVGAALYNPVHVGQRITKPYQLALLEAEGLPVPRTLWSNDPESVRAFCAGGPAIYKPVAGGAYTREVQESDLTDERLAKLAAAPVCFQETLTGKDIRVYVIDGKVIAAIRIDSSGIDFRGNEESMTLFEPSPELADICVRAARVMGLRYTGMDLRSDADGNHRILELNPSAMFLGFEARSGARICDALCDALVEPASFDA